MKYSFIVTIICVILGLGNIVQFLVNTPEEPSNEEPSNIGTVPPPFQVDTSSCYEHFHSLGWSVISNGITSEGSDMTILEIREMAKEKDFILNQAIPNKGVILDDLSGRNLIIDIPIKNNK